MTKFKFDLTAGFSVRKKVRQHLEASKQTLEYNFGGNVSIREDKGFWESQFFIIGTNFPDSTELTQTLKSWEQQLKSLEN